MKTLKNEHYFTPEKIDHLEDNEIFVFGSNANGNHYGGAARVAFDKFGAEWGVGEGLTGNTYAIPTLDKNMKIVTDLKLRKSFIRFIYFAEKNESKKFYLTKVGCGIAGWTVEEVKKILWSAAKECFLEYKLPSNIVIPEEFYLSNSELHELELEREILIKKARTAVTDEEREMIHDQLLDNESSINTLKSDLSE